MPDQECDKEYLQMQFLICQYKSLREEIGNTKDRMLKIILGQGFVVPGAQYLADYFDEDIFRLALPALVLVLAIVFVSENNTLYRAGQYIKDCVEPYMVQEKTDRYSEGSNKFLGWEHWLELDYGETDAKLCARNADNLLKMGFCILTMIYYVASVHMALEYNFSDQNYKIVATLIYLVIAIVIFIVLIFLCRTSTSKRSPFLELYCSWRGKK